MARNIKINLSLIKFCLAGLLLAYGSWWAFCSIRFDGRPNVVMIVTDDIGIECFSFAGSADYQTPNLDRLATNGLAFSHCYAQPLCTPSRVKLMTGKYNFRNYDEFGYLSPRERTIGNVMRDAGYQTCISGKWQLNGHFTKEPRFDDPRRPADAGFDRSCLWQVSRRKSAGGCYYNPRIEIDGELQAKRKFNGKYGPDIFCEFLCQFIRKNRSRPFFAYYPMVLAHPPFHLPPRLPNARSNDLSKMSEGERKQMHFKQMVEYADMLVGRVTACLESEGLRENTIIIFTSDNGTPPQITSAKSDGSIVLGGKGRLTDAGTHVPLVFSGPTVSMKGVSDEMVDFADIFPTLVEIAGEEPSRPFDGVSLLPVLSGLPRETKPFAYCYYNPKFHGFESFSGEFIRDQQFKLYRDGRFYNIWSDPNEENPITADNELLRVRRIELQGWLESVRTE